MEPVGLDLGLEKTHVVITGAAGYIGRQVTAAFLEAGCKVSALDLSADGLQNLREGVSTTKSGLPETAKLTCYEVDITSEKGMTDTFNRIVKENGSIECCVAMAALDLSVLEHHESILDLPFEQWKRTLDVNVNGTFLTAKLWLRQLRLDAFRATRRNQSLIIVGSERGVFGEKGNADYGTSKSAVQVGLLQSLRAEIPKVVNGARVNAIAPGPVDTPRFKEECKEDPDLLWRDSQATAALGKSVSANSVARAILFLASDNWSSNIHGEVLNVNSGKQGKIMWTKEEAKLHPLSK